MSVQTFHAQMSGMTKSGSMVSYHPGMCGSYTWITTAAAMNPRLRGAEIRQATSPSTTLVAPTPLGAPTPPLTPPPTPLGAPVESDVEEMSDRPVGSDTQDEDTEDDRPGRDKTALAPAPSLAFLPGEAGQDVLPPGRATLLPIPALEPCKVRVPVPVPAAIETKTRGCGGR